MIRLTKRRVPLRGGKGAGPASLLASPGKCRFTLTPGRGPSEGSARGSGSGRWRILRNVGRHIPRDFPAALPVPRIPRADLDDRPRLVGADAVGGHPVHRVGRVHAQHPASRDRCRRPVRRGHRVRHDHPAGTGGDRARGRRCGRHRDLRRPRCAHDPRGDRRDAGARHRSDPAAGGAARAGIHSRRAATERLGVRDRPEWRLRVLGLAAGREPGRLHQRVDHLDRPPGVGARRGEGTAVRGVRRPRRLLPRPDGQGRSERRRKCGQRDRGLCVHLPVRDQRVDDRGRRPSSGAALMSYDLTVRLRRIFGGVPRFVDSFGEQALFYAQSIRWIPNAVTHYPKETVRLIAEMTLGTGALLLIGCTVGVAAFLTLASGGVIAVQGYSSLGNIGIEALTGFLSAFLNVRIVAPVIAGIALAATIGAGTTAQLGAMRVAEEIDAVEAMAVHSVSYLVSTRLVAGMVAIIPLYSLSVLAAFFAARFTTVFVNHQSAGLYDHYFNTFLVPTDLLWSFLQAIVMSIAVMLVHTYYGYNASGGPVGVGMAVGQAVRTSLIVVVTITLFISLAVYGASGNFNLSG